MIGKLAGWNDTIAALATPQGIGAIGVIRVSGTRTFEILNEIFPSKNLMLQPTHTLHVGFLKYNNIAIDEVVLALFRGPKSYTGEDVIEISCHGSHYILNDVLQVLAQLGARAAKAGEFTQRAYINGKLDLAQAEAVADLIASNTEASRKTALQNMRGGFTVLLKDVREELLKFSSLIELELDFAEEDVEFADRTGLLKLLADADKKVRLLLESFTLGNVIKNGVQVAIIGKPNAGKSTLLNALLREERAIVSDIAGTTRDTIEETLNIKGILFRLIDTAGIRQHSGDVIESMGMEKSMEKMRSADVVIYLFDVNEMSAEDLQNALVEMRAAGIKVLVVGNKAEGGFAGKFDDENVIFISAKKGENIEILLDALYTAVVNNDVASSDTIVTNIRHVEALRQVVYYIEEIQAGFAAKTPVDLISADIRACLHYIGTITGEVTNEDQLDYIFSKFCIGK